MDAETKGQESFRDHFDSVREDGKRNWFYPQKPKGKWHNRRIWFTVLILGILFTGPFLHRDGQPLFLFNILERKIILFGFFIGPQDYWLFGLLMIAAILLIVLFTNMLGRLWCGWACPQTVFMEMVFRKIEYAIEGDWNKQRALDKAPWTPDKIFKKGSKWVIFFIISFIIANLLLAYIIGVKELYKLILQPIGENLGTLSALMVFTLIFFFDFAWLRDQACTVICPYGRLQGVFLDRKSTVVAYDHKRGEPREKLRKSQERSEGDCINCFQCVHVCPTGIDIRNGTQMECISCTACIDACDSIMDKVGFEKGLIRYASEETIINGKSRKLSIRKITFTVMIIAICSVLGFILLNRTDTSTTLLRVPGSQYTLSEKGVGNLYTYKIFNKTNREISPEFRLDHPDGNLNFIGTNQLLLEPSGMLEGSVLISIPLSELGKRKTIIKLSVHDKGVFLEDFTTTFIAPEQ